MYFALKFTFLINSMWEVILILVDEIILSMNDLWALGAKDYNNISSKVGCLYGIQRKPQLLSLL